MPSLLTNFKFMEKIPSGIGRQHIATRSRQSSAANGRFKRWTQFVVWGGREEHDLDLTWWCMDLAPDADNDDKDAFLFGAEVDDDTLDHAGNGHELHSDLQDQSNRPRDVLHLQRPCRWGDLQVEPLWTGCLFWIQIPCRVNWSDLGLLFNFIGNNPLLHPLF